MLKQKGYTTAAIGKWHLGLGEGAPDWNGNLKPWGRLKSDLTIACCCRRPMTVSRRFSSRTIVCAISISGSALGRQRDPSPDHPTGITHRDTLKMDWSHGHNGTIHNGISRIGFYTGGMKARFRDEDLADEWVHESNQFIEASRDQPFFLYFAAHDIHVPRAPNERFAGKSGLGPRGDCIVEFDWCVGELMKTLDRLGLAENTLVVLCSDNGPVLDDGYKDDAVEKLGSHLPAGPFSGGKYSVLEGGTRTPFITRWKGRIQPGVSDEMVCTIDLPASFAALTGASIPANACLTVSTFSGPCW